MATSYISLNHLNRRYTLPIVPDSVSDRSQSNFSTNTPLGRSAPVYIYNGSGPREVSLSFDLHRELEGGSNIDDIVKGLQASVMPTYGGARKIVAPTVTLSIINTVRITGVCRNVDIEWKKPIINNHYQLCTISLSISELSAYDAYNVLATGSRR